MDTMNRPRFALFAALLTMAASARADEPAPAPCDTAADRPELVWQTDYAEAMQQAERQKKMLLIYFRDEAGSPAAQRFEAETLTDDEIRGKLAPLILLQLASDATIKVHGQVVKLLEHQAFAEMERTQGIAILDFANPETEHYGHVVSTLPFKSGKYYRFRPDHLAVLLDLPSGTITQRALVFAVRIHPEAPASAKGELDPHLVGEARSHSKYQAQIRVQGHHHWDRRFHRIAALLPFGLRAQEVVAESWPQENLLDAAVDCVHSWRQSSGHWGAVKSRQPRFGYDMQRGSNGIWYATGIFGNRG